MKLNKSLKEILFSEISIFIILWILYLLVPIDLDVDDYDFHLDLNQVGVVSYYILLVSLNNFVLIPRYLSEGKHFQYLLWILGTLFVFSFVDDTLIEYLFEGDDDLSFSIMSGVFYSFFRMGVLVIVFGSFKLIWDYRQQKEKMNTLEKERIESELKFLKSQINPHVLFNYLNSIYYYTIEKSDKVPDMVLKLSDIMRYMLYEANERFVPLKKELEYIENFIELEKIRHKGRGDVNFSIEGETENLKIAPLLLISFIENSFKHSHQTLTEDIFISIKISIKNGWLEFKAINNWSETGWGDHGQQSGIGLKNVRKRLELLYPDQHSLQIDNDGGFFTVKMKIDLHHGKN